jgi:hypothetical protein
LFPEAWFVNSRIAWVFDESNNQKTIIVTV